MKYYIVVGEASGDLHAANLIKNLKLIDSDAQFRCFGGDCMEAQGALLVRHYRDLAYMGFIPVLINLRKILRNLKFCKQDIKSYSPDVVILVDYPGFNLKVAKYVKTKLNKTVHYYISPKVWAWKKHRIKHFKKYVDKMLCILPFEVDFFKKHNYDVCYVGNPSVDEIENREFKDESFLDFIQFNNLENKPIISILPGSRKQEIKDNLPLMIACAEKIKNYQIIIAGAPNIDIEYYNRYIRNKETIIIFNQTYRILSQSSVALVTSGTATLEAAILNAPQIVCYKTPLPRFIYWCFKHILYTPYISLVNLISNKYVVKELFAKYFTEENITKELNNILFDKDYNSKMLDNYKNMREILGSPGASENAAKFIYNQLKKS